MVGDYLDSRSMRVRLLATACCLVLPGTLHAQTSTATSNCAGTGTSCNIGGTGAPPQSGTTTGTETKEVRLDQQDSLTVATGGSIVSTTGTSVNINAATSGNGVAITNNGNIQGNATAAGAGNGRGISSSGDFTARTVAIVNAAGANIIGSNDAIRFSASTSTLTLPGTIAIDNGGNIVSNGQFGGNLVQSGQGIENTILGSTLNVTNRAGALISGSQGILSAAATTTIINSGTITGTAAFSTQGEAIRTNLVTITTGVAPSAGTTLSVTNEATGNITGVYGIIGTGPSNTIVNRGTISGSNVLTTGTTGTITREAIRLNAASRRIRLTWSLWRREARRRPVRARMRRQRGGFRGNRRGPASP